MPIVSQVCESFTCIGSSTLAQPALQEAGNPELQSSVGSSQHSSVTYTSRTRIATWLTPIDTRTHAPTSESERACDGSPLSPESYEPKKSSVRTAAIHPLCIPIMSVHGGPSCPRTTSQVLAKSVNANANAITGRPLAMADDRTEQVDRLESEDRDARRSVPREPCALKSTTSSPKNYPSFTHTSPSPSPLPRDPAPPPRKKNHEHLLYSSSSKLDNQKGGKISRLCRAPPQLEAPLPLPPGQPSTTAHPVQPRLQLHRPAMKQPPHRKAEIVPPQPRNLFSFPSRCTSDARALAPRGDSAHARTGGVGTYVWST